jgi:tetratricopeptide (TPR) repeat protein
LWFCVFLVATTLAVYGQVRNYDFVNYDDAVYVTANPHVQAGLTPAGLAWAFTSGAGANWLPLTWISHMLDCQLFGLRAGMHHLVNVLFHALSVLLLFLLLRQTTAARWRSAFVAFLFALHPLHVESVAWIAERKDVLSGFFWFLALWLYAIYVKRPRAGAYLPVLLAFCLGLLAKPMIVTLPFALLLFDVWPLRRLPVAGFSARRLAFLLWEKAPFFALSIGASVATFVVQQRGGAVSPIDLVPLSVRFGNALVAYVTYAAQMFWPARLAVFYPLAEVPAWRAAAAGLALLVVSVLTLRSIRTRPYLAAGWFWYLGTLVPVIGLVQVGFQAHADRYTYIPLLGIFIILAWGLADLAERWPRAKGALAGLSAAGCAACLVLTWFQVQYWRDSIPLFQHAVDVTANNYWAYNSLGSVLTTEGRAGESVPLLTRAVEIKPDFADAHYNLGRALTDVDRVEEGAAQFAEAVRLQPDDAEAHYNLGTALAAMGRFAEAVDALGAAARLKPGNPMAHLNLGSALAESGRLDEAIAQFSEALRIQPDLEEARANLDFARALQRESENGKK